MMKTPCNSTGQWPAEHEQDMLDVLVNSIPGGIASYLIEGDKIIPTFFSDGVPRLSGHTRKEFTALVDSNALNIIYEADRERVVTAVKTAVETGNVLDISYRMRHKDNTLIWIHLNGRRVGPLCDRTKFYAVFTGMSEESRLFQNIANETADAIYVIDKSTYTLLYVNESKGLFANGNNCTGEPCYKALHGKDAPCESCPLVSRKMDGEVQELSFGRAGHFYSIHFRETIWKGSDAYINYIRDITEEVNTRREKERLEQYFQTILKYLPGGVAVVRFEKLGQMIPEFMSEGFAEMTQMPLAKAWALYQKDAMAGVHPADCEYVTRQMADYIKSGDSRCEIVYRLKKGDGSYMWVKNSLSMILSEDGEQRIYSVYHDMTKEREEEQRIRRHYNDLLMQHYHPQDPSVLIMGHCNITRNIILEINDRTGSDMLATFGNVREEFFTGMGTLIPDENERNTFYGKYLNKPSLQAFEKGENEQIMTCFVQFPKEERGRYVQIMMELVATPDCGDVTGILTVQDITDQFVADRILHNLSITGYEYVADLDLSKDQYRILSASRKAHQLPPSTGRYSEWIALELQNGIVPRDLERYQRFLEPNYLVNRLKKENIYTFTYSTADPGGDILTKNVTISAIDLRLGRICLARTDITESVREQQGLLRLIAYTFELAGFINLDTKSLTFYTRDTVLNNQPPLYMESYSDSIQSFISHFSKKENREEAQEQFKIETLLLSLKEKPSGYDFLFPYTSGGEERYKQINVMWGDVNHRTICLVRADVTDMLTSERKTKKALEEALALAEEASQAKSDFLSAMSHDIRTPMNAIMGMTTLASAYLGDEKRVADCLEKISASSKHLLSLINDILDMSKIERAQITLNHVKIRLSELLGQLSDIMSPQAKKAGLSFIMQTRQISHKEFYGDSLRISQILINLLNNAVKYTPEGGTVKFITEEIPSREKNGCRYRFTVSDTGVGMTEEFLNHIFEPFTRSRNMFRIEGTGLGLSITKGLVDLMGGTITVESKVYEGSCFQVELELEYGCEEEVPPEEEISPSDMPSKPDAELFAGRHFLVAEDNEINAEILCELLSMNGAKTTVRTDGRQAVEAFVSEKPNTFDAVLMDVQMPEMNGYEAARAIRTTKREDAKDIPIIAMTANAFSEDIKAALDAGMDAHVAKPIDLPVLQMTLKNALAKTSKKKYSILRKH